MKKQLHLINTADFFLKPEPKIVKAEPKKAKSGITKTRPSALEAALSAARVQHTIDRAKSENKFQKIVRESGIIKNK